MIFFFRSFVYFCTFSSFIYFFLFGFKHFIIISYFVLLNCNKIQNNNKKIAFSFKHETQQHNLGFFFCKLLKQLVVVVVADITFEDKIIIKKNISNTYTCVLFSICRKSKINIEIDDEFFPGGFIIINKSSHHHHHRYKQYTVI